MSRLSSSSSKVSVEYHDPSGIFPLIASQLHSRLPLRNLHWNSHSRPLRSIGSLHVDLVPSDDGQTPTPSRPDTPASSQANVANLAAVEGGGNNTSVGPEVERPAEGIPQRQFGPAKERRHQIPGLRETPYLKIYLLRCDDSETYKASSRKLIRDWVKKQSPSTSSSTSVNKSEKHDAFEWLILHVVLPGTPAAAQSRWSGGTAGTGAAEKTAGPSRFLGKGSSTIFEKISADFNGTGKMARDRTAQVRLRKEDLPESAQVQTPDSPATYDEDQQEGPSTWDDLIAKMKSLILTSFDMRVTQYEEDIREKDSQRALPGWNFCTFFVLKEGLARGFESVGLVEDALIIHDELALGLEAIVRERTSGNREEHHGGTFLEYTTQLHDQLKAYVQDGKRDETHGGHSTVDAMKSEACPSELLSVGRPTGANKRQFRELILGNNISIFDFQCYIFSRQLCLLLRLGHGLSVQDTKKDTTPYEVTVAQDTPASNAEAPPRPRAKATEENENLFALAEICRRSLDFITSGARMMRFDLYEGMQHEQSGAADEQNPKLASYKGIASVVDNMVSSWEFAVSQQILRETSTVSMDYLTSGTEVAKPLPTSGSQATAAERAMATGPSPTRLSVHPTRTSSLPPPSPPGTVTHTSDPVTAASPVSQADPSDAQYASAGPPKTAKAGSDDLASARALLYLLARRVASHLAEKRGWVIDCANISLSTIANNADRLQEVSLDADEVDTPMTESANRSPLAMTGIDYPPLQSSLTDEDAFHHLYENLTRAAFEHFVAAEKTKSSQRCNTDLAILKCHQGDYATAASYFHQIAPFYAETKWDALEFSTLVLYANCLKRLDRKDDYVRVILKVLAKQAAEKLSRTSSLPDTRSDVTALAADLLSYSKHIQHERSVPLDRYASHIRTSQCIRHYDDKDGFKLQVSFRWLLEGQYPFQSVRVKLSSVEDGQAREIWLQSDNVGEIGPGLVSMWTHSNVSVYGLYSVDTIVLRCHQIVFTYNFEAQRDAVKSSSIGLNEPDPEESSHVLCYPHGSALQANLLLSRDIHLDRSRSVEVEICSGWNEIETGELRVRAASAGLRLHVAEAVLVDGSIIIDDSPRIGVIPFREMHAGSVARLRIPYAFESELNELSLKVEISYTTEKGDFFYATNPSLPIVLPLGVNVQDNFKENMLLSKFIVSSVSSIPIRLLSSRLEGSATFETKPAAGQVAGIDISRRQPASLLFKITRKGEATTKDASGHRMETSLSLSIDYACIDEEVIGLVQTCFTQALEASPLKDSSRLLMPVLLASLRSKLTVNELEKATLIHEIDLGTFEDMHWQRSLIWLPASLREPGYQWLMEWHENNRVVRLDAIFGPSPEYRSHRRIVIPVEVPSVSVLHTVKLTMTPSDHDVQSSGGLAAVGQLIPATLTIKHTRSWDSSGEAASPGDERALDFSYEVHANPDDWLVAGRRRARFRAKEHKTHRFALALLPQRPGHLLYPAVEVRALAGDGETSGARHSSTDDAAAKDGAARRLPPIQCEVDYRHQADVVQVLANLRSSTVRLEPGGAGPWLVEWEERTTEMARVAVGT